MRHFTLLPCLTNYMAKEEVGTTDPVTGEKSSINPVAPFQIWTRVPRASILSRHEGTDEAILGESFDRTPWPRTGSEIVLMYMFDYRVNAVVLQVKRIKRRLRRLPKGL